MGMTTGGPADGGSIRWQKPGPLPAWRQRCGSGHPVTIHHAKPQGELPKATRGPDPSAWCPARARFRSSRGQPEAFRP